MLLIVDKNNEVREGSQQKVWFLGVEKECRIQSGPELDLDPGLDPEGLCDPG